MKRHRVADRGKPEETYLTLLAQALARQPDLSTDDHVGGLEVVQDAAEVLFRFTITVLDRGVKVIHTGRDCACDSALLVERIAAHHQPADRAAAETQYRELHSGAAEHPHLHRHSPSTRARPYYVAAACCTPSKLLTYPSI